jgi:hypothetical protein
MPSCAKCGDDEQSEREPIPRIENPLLATASSAIQGRLSDTGVLRGAALRQVEDAEDPHDAVDESDNRPNDDGCAVSHE